MSDTTFDKTPGASRGHFLSHCLQDIIHVGQSVMAPCDAKADEQDLVSWPVPLGALFAGIGGRLNVKHAKHVPGLPPGEEERAMHLLFPLEELILVASGDMTGKDAL